MNPTGKCLPLGPDCSMKFSQFHPLLPPEKTTFLFCLVCPPPSRWPSFEHSSTKMGSLDIELVYSTLCPSITATYSMSKFYLNMLQYSIGGAVMLNTITYSQDCTAWNRTWENASLK